MENGGDSNNVAKKRRGGSGGAGSAGFAKGGARTSSGGLSTAGEYSGNSWESVFLQVLTLTFLAKWGDRSQIAMIALMTCFGNWQPLAHRKQCPPVMSGCCLYALQTIYAYFFSFPQKNILQDPVGVKIGGCMGHSVCTGMAVVGGRMLASRILEKSVAF